MYRAGLLSLNTIDNVDHVMLCWVAVLCIVVLSVAPLASTHQMLIAPLVMLLEISPGIATCPLGGNAPPFENHW